MDIVEHYVKLNDTITQLEQEAPALRYDIVRGAAQLQSSPYDVAMRQQPQRAVAGCPTFLRPETQVQIDLLRYRC